MVEALESALVVKKEYEEEAREWSQEEMNDSQILGDEQKWNECLQHLMSMVLVLY